MRWALVVSIALHALLLLGYLTRDLDAPAVVLDSLRSLEVVLTPAVEEVTETIPEATPETFTDTPIIDERANRPADTAELDALPIEPQRPSLNLERPGHWDSLVLDSPEAAEGLVFKRSTRAAITRRRERQEAQRALSRSQVARLGLPAETFRRETDDGEEVKTAKGCFIKRQEQGPSGGQTRWWRTRCVDAKKPAWTRQALSFGPDHRVDTEAQEQEIRLP